MTRKIVSGYKGIMDLDLTNIPLKFHKELVSLHMKDIDEYKLEQAKRSPNTRYENTVVKSEKYWKIYYDNVRRRREELESKWFKYREHNVNDEKS